VTEFDILRNAAAGMDAGRAALDLAARNVAASEADGALEPLRRIARSDYTALAKAAQRGRLRSVVRSGRYFTTPEWIAEYRSGLASRAR